MDVNSANLRTLYVGYNAAFQRGVGSAPTQYGSITMPVQSSTKSIDYGMLGKLPSVREWIGPRVVNALNKYSYRIDEKPWEETVEVDRDDIETDNLGIYTPLFENMGEATSTHYDTLAFATLLGGFASPCYDNQHFFDTSHPVLDAGGNTILVANTDGGAGTPWFLVDNTRAVKPLILQRRKGWSNLIRKDREEDENVFNEKKFIYGADARYNMGYGLWQYCWGSKQPLNAANYGAARAALYGMKGDFGRPIGAVPSLLIVPPTYESAGRQLLNSEYGTAGVTNEWKGTAELMVCPWLA